ncbi:hypothetical protein Tco_0909736 [Tanacetum coccineum]|uniref:Uncharacterized protein n=1 Tax=Tanacetum coccineum TaxID=301880 RepID=A0ABQ5CU98_9ASTR
MTKQNQGMEKNCAKSRPKSKNAKVKSIPEESAVKPVAELKNTIECNLNPSDGPKAQQEKEEANAALIAQWNVFRIRIAWKSLSGDGDDVTIKATPLSTKSPTIIDYKIYKEGKKSYFQIIRADVKARFKKTEPENYMDIFLHLNLKTMFEHHLKDNVWKNQQGPLMLFFSAENNFWLYVSGEDDLAHLNNGRIDLLSFVVFGELPQKVPSNAWYVSPLASISCAIHEIIHVENLP